MNTPAPRAWGALVLLLALAAIGGWWADPHSLDWQPGLAAREPWRAFTAVAIHYSPLHLGANLAGALLVGALGVVARVPLRIVLAWLVAWPLTQVGLLLRPELAHYGGLSGVLHAGVVAAGLWLVVHDRGRRQLIGVAILGVVLVKIVGEAPWGPAVQRREGWDIAVAPFAHASGAFCGLLCARLSLLLPSSSGHDH